MHDPPRTFAGLVAAALERPGQPRRLPARAGALVLRTARQAHHQLPQALSLDDLDSGAGERQSASRSGSAGSEHHPALVGRRHRRRLRCGRTLVAWRLAQQAPASSCFRPGSPASGPSRPFATPAVPIPLPVGRPRAATSVLDISTRHRVPPRPGPEPSSSTYQRIVSGATWRWLGGCPATAPLPVRHAPASTGCVSARGSADQLRGSWQALVGGAERALGVAGEDFRDLGSPAAPATRWTWCPRLLDAVVGRAAAHRTPARARPTTRNTETFNDRPRCKENGNCIPVCRSPPSTTRSCT